MFFYNSNLKTVLFLLSISIINNNLEKIALSLLQSSSITNGRKIMESDLGQYSFSCLRVGLMSSCRVDHVFVSG